MENILNISLANLSDIYYAVALKAILESIGYEYEYASLEYADDEIMHVFLDDEELILRYDFDADSGSIEFELLDVDEYEEEYGPLDDEFLDEEDFEEDDGFFIYGVDVEEDGSMTMDGEYDYQEFTAYWDAETRDVTVLDENDDDITDEISEEFYQEICDYFDAFEVYAYYEEQDCYVIDARDVNRLIIARYYPKEDRIAVFGEDGGEDITASVPDDTMEALRDEFENWDENEETLEF